MRKVSIIGVVMGFIAAGLMWGTGGQSPARAEGPRLLGFGASLRTDQSVYQSAQPIRITFEVFNHTPKPVRLNFATGQRFDVVIEDHQGKEIWRWSSGRVFTMALGQETIGPAKPRLTYDVQLPEGLPTGRYKIKAVLTDTKMRVSATIPVTVQ